MQSIRVKLEQMKNEEEKTKHLSKSEKGIDYFLILTVSYGLFIKIWTFYNCIILKVYATVYYFDRC